LGSELLGGKQISGKQTILGSNTYGVKNLESKKNEKKSQKTPFIPPFKMLTRNQPLLAVAVT
jgi:hypothetical protein